MNKREMIERALGPFLVDVISDKGFSEKRTPVIFATIDALAEQAIVIECEVEHESSPAEKLTKVMFYDDAGSILTGVVRDHQGREGKALAIIISIYVRRKDESSS